MNELEGYQRRFAGVGRIEAWVSGELLGNVFRSRAYAWLGENTEV